MLGEGSREISSRTHAMKKGKGKVGGQDFNWQKKGECKGNQEGGGINNTKDV